MRKKLSDMTPFERVNSRMKGMTWEEAEEVGVEILARNVALHIYARKEGEDYIASLTEKICNRADQWAHEGNNPTLLAFASVGYKTKKKE